MDTTKKYLFLLGGKDLEMVEIRRLLERSNSGNSWIILDKHLTWDNAYWSAYSEEIAKYAHTHQIVGIELFSDEELTYNPDWILIDHHNERSDEHPSILQLIELIQYRCADAEDRRRIELVAANDADGVFGLAHAGATDVEIKRIREEERNLLGVRIEDLNTFKEEMKASGIVERNGVRLLKTSLDGLTALSDHFLLQDHDIFDLNYILYNDTSLIFYGPDAKHGVLKYVLNHGQLKYFYGGQRLGYISVFNIPEGLNTDDLVGLICSALEKSHLQSLHTFLFPFRWDMVKGIVSPDINIQQEIALDDRIQLADFAKIIEEGEPATPGVQWKQVPFEFGHTFDREMKYNEFVYFHPFVHDLIYDFKENDGQKEELVRYFELQMDGEGEMSIATYRKVYFLHLYGVSLHIFAKGIAVLTFQLKNNRYSDIEDILNINDYGRRVYPQFLAAPEKKAQLYSLISPDNLTFGVKNAFLASWLRIRFLTKLDRNVVKLTEDFRYFNQLTGLNHKSVKHLPDTIFKLFPKPVSMRVSETTDLQLVIRPSVDDRMFTICAVGNTGLARDLCSWDEADDKYKWENSVLWNRIVNSDSGYCTTQSYHMLVKSNILQTYDRWANFGTLYGVSRESFVLLTNDFLQEKFELEVLSKHMQYMYYQIIIICLIQRAGVLRFSAEVGALASLDFGDRRNFNMPLSTKQRIANSRAIVQMVDRIASLHKNYIEFVNKMYFREVTAQIQGIELYTKLQEVMYIREEIKELDKEIQELYEYAMMMQQKEETSQANETAIKANKIARLGVIYLPTTVVFGVLGANIYPDHMQFLGNWDSNTVYWLTLGFILGGLGTLLGFIYLKKKGN